MTAPDYEAEARRWWKENTPNCFVCATGEGDCEGCFQRVKDLVALLERLCGDVAREAEKERQLTLAEASELCTKECAELEAQLSEARAEVEKLWRTIDGQTKELADWSTRAEKAEAALEQARLEHATELRKTHDGAWERGKEEGAREQREAHEKLWKAARAFTEYFLNWASAQGLSEEGRVIIEKYRADLAEVDAQAIRREGER